MAEIYQKQYEITATAVDRFDRLRLSGMMAMVQEVAGDHSKLLGAGWDQLQDKKLFWAVIRHRVEIARLPKSGEVISLETWPMPTTRTAYPRACVAYDAEGNELFRSISLWILMDLDSRAMILPGKSGVLVEGLLRGNELAAPGSLLPKELENQEKRTVRYTELDINGHMNNCRYLDWVQDLLPGDFHRQHCPRELVACYLSEAREGQTLELSWSLDPEGQLQMDAQRSPDDSVTGHSRVFSAKVLY